LNQKENLNWEHGTWYQGNSLPMSKNGSWEKNTLGGSDARMAEMQPKKGVVSMEDIKDRAVLKVLTPGKNH